MYNRRNGSRDTLFVLQRNSSFRRQMAEAYNKVECDWTRTMTFLEGGNMVLSARQFHKLYFSIIIHGSVELPVLRYTSKRM